MAERSEESKEIKSGNMRQSKEITPVKSIGDFIRWRKGKGSSVGSEFEFDPKNIELINFLKKEFNVKEVCRCQNDCYCYWK